MAAQNIQINIGTSYNGEGMTRALGAVNGFSRDAGKAAGAVARLGSSFETLGGTAGKSIGAISAAVNALMSGGVFGAIIFAITSIIQLFQKMGQDDSMDKLKKNLDELKESSSELVSELNVATSKIDKYTAAVDRLASAHQRLAKAQAEAKIAALSDGIGDMEEGPDKIVATGEAALKAARINADASNSAASSRVSAVDNKINSINDKIKLVTDTITMLTDDLGKYDLAVANAEQRLYAMGERGADAEERQEVKEQVKLAQKARNEFITKTLNPAIQQKNELEESLKGAMVERLAAETERANIERENAEKLKIAEKAYRGALAEATDVREAEISEEESMVAEQEARALEWQRIIAVEKQIAQTAKAVKDAQDDYARALRRASDAADAVQTIANGGAWNPNGAVAGARNENNWTTFGKARGWDQRYWQTHQAEAAANGVQAGLTKSEQAEYNNLVGKWMGGQDLSESQKKRLRELAARDPEQQKLRAEQAADKAKEKLTDAQQTAKNTKDIYELLKQRLNELGLS